jgi:hypothetical protein
VAGREDNDCDLWGLGHYGIRNRMAFVGCDFGIQALGIRLFYQTARVLLAMLLICRNIHGRIITKRIGGLLKGLKDQ